MRKSMTVKALLSVSICAFAVQVTAETTTEQRVAQSRASAKSLMQALKSELQAAMKAGGPVNAVGVCHTRAGSITDAQVRDDGLRIRRTSLKVRNPANVADAWEASVLEQFEKRKAAGEDIRTLEYHEVTEDGGRRTFRWMKAIPTAEVCLACHGGESVAPEVEAKLAALYPRDQARGFQVGDIRGAFSVTQPMY